TGDASLRKMLDDLHQEIETAKQRYFDDLIDSAGDNPRDFWRYQRSLRSDGNHITSIDFNGRSCNDGQKISDLLADFFASVDGTSDEDDTEEEICAAGQLDGS